MPLAYLVRDRMLHRWNGTAESYTPPAFSHGVLPVGRIFDGAAPGQQPDQHGHLRPGQTGHGRTGPGF